MQFRGHSLPVHQSMSVPWEFFSSSDFISQFPPTRFLLITAIRTCHLLPVHHLGMAFLAGSKGQNITLVKNPFLFLSVIISSNDFCELISSHFSTLSGTFNNLNFYMFFLIQGICKANLFPSSGIDFSKSRTFQIFLYLSTLT